MSWLRWSGSEQLAAIASTHCMASFGTATATAQALLPPGMACGVLRSGVDGRARLEVGCAGQRQAVSGASPCGLTDLWHLGSNTKALTALLAAVCIERGEFGLDWGSTVGAVLGAAAGDGGGGGETIHAGYGDVTLLELLSNSGGAPGTAPDAAWTLAWERARAGGPPIAQRRAFVSALLAQPPAAARGSYEYSNQGFAIAGHMLETAAAATTGQSYEQLLTSLVFKPLGVTSAGFGAVPGTDSPWGHTLEQTAWLPKDPSELNADNPPAITPAGCVHMTLEDYGRCLAPMLSAQIAEEQLGLSRGMRAFFSTEIREPRVETSPDSGKQGPGYALGWLAVKRPWAEGGVAMTHSGSNTMNYCTVWCVPALEGGADGSTRREGTEAGRLDGMAVLVACNAGGGPAQAAVDSACVSILRSEIAEARKRGASF